LVTHRNTAIAINVVMCLMYPFSLDPVVWSKRYHVVVWLLCVVPTAILLGLDAFGPTGGEDWCWISGARNPLRLFYYGPLLVCVIICILALIYVVWKSRELSLTPTQRMHFVFRTSVFVILFVAFWFWAIFDRVYEYFLSSPYWLKIVHSVAVWCHPGTPRVSG
jgi:hypothetical protein